MESRKMKWTHEHAMRRASRFYDYNCKNYRGKLIELIALQKHNIAWFARYNDKRKNGNRIKLIIKRDNYIDTVLQRENIRNIMIDTFKNDESFTSIKLYFDKIFGDIICEMQFQK